MSFIKLLLLNSTNATASAIAPSKNVKRLYTKPHVTAVYPGWA